VSVDEVVGRALRDLAEQVRPEQDPFGRVQARRRRSRHRRRGVVAATLVVALVATWLVARPHRTPEPPPATGFDAVRIWAQRLADTPVRGQVAAADPAYVAEVARLIGDHRRDGVYLTQYSIRTVQILFVDDIGPWRIAIVALPLTDPSPTSWTHAEAVFRAPRGAGADELTRTESLQGYGDGLEPFTHTELDDDKGTVNAVVALAPAGCTMYSAAWPAVSQWQAEPTGSYLVRDKATARAEWWRVECAGRIQDELPAPYDTGVLAVTDQVVDLEMQTARGTPDRRQATELLGVIRHGAVSLTGMPRLVWGGRIGWPDGEAQGHAGITTIASAPAIRGGWYGEANIRYDLESNGTLGLGVSFWTAENPADPDATVAIRLGEGSGVLVVVPATAVSVRALVNGAVVGQATVADDAAVLTVPDPSGATFEALDGDGKVVGRTRIGEPPAITPAAANWMVL